MRSGQMAERNVQVFRPCVIRNYVKVVSILLEIYLRCCFVGRRRIVDPSAIELEIR